MSEEETADMPIQSPAEVTIEQKQSDDGIKNFLLKLDIPKSVMDIIYWKNKINSSIAFFSAMVLLHSFGKYRFHVVLCTLIMSSIFVTLTVTLSLHFLKNINRLHELNPIPRGLAYDITTWKTYLKELSSYLVDRLIDFMIFIQGLTFVKDIPATIKTFLFCYLIYVFNGFMNFNTLLQLFTVILFTFPYIYSLYQPIIDTHSEKITKFVSSKLENVIKTMPPSIKNKLVQFGVCTKHPKKE